MWEEAFEKEVKTLESHGNIKVIEQPKDTGEIVLMQTIFEEKMNNITSEVKVKAHIVARGDKSRLKKTSKKGELYLPVASIVVVKLLLAIAAAFKMKVC